MTASREFDAVVDKHPIGGATLRDHSANIARRIADQARELEALSSGIAQSIFGPEPEPADSTGNAEPPQLVGHSVSDDLELVDRTLNRISNALDRMRRIRKSLGGGLGIPDLPSKTAYPDETASARQRY